MGAADYETGSQSEPSSRRVLVVDDNNAAAQTLSWGLDLLGFDVKTCSDGLSALETADAFQPEIILLDIGMPGMNGYEVCRKLRQNDALLKTKIVAQTGWSHAEFRRRAYDAGFDHYLVKPIDMSRLHKALTGLLDLAHI